MATHPPPPGDILTPNFLAIEEALGNVTFPITKRDLLDQVSEGSALVGGQNVDLEDIVAKLPADYFETEEDLRSSLEEVYGLAEDPDPEPLPSGPKSGWQADVGPGNSGDKDAYFEPGE